MIDKRPEDEKGLCIRFTEVESHAEPPYRRHVLHSLNDHHKVNDDDSVTVTHEQNPIDGGEAFHYLLRTLIWTHADPKTWCRDEAENYEMPHRTDCIVVAHATFSIAGDLWVTFEGCFGETQRLQIKLGGGRLLNRCYNQALGALVAIASTHTAELNGTVHAQEALDEIERLVNNDAP
jgi:hypothetical protein